MKKNFFISLFIVFILTLSACNDTSKDEPLPNESRENKISELEEKIDDLNSIIAKQEDTIEELEMKLNSNQTASEKTTEEKDLPVLKLGDTYSDDSIDVTVSQIEYTTSPNKGVRIYFEVVNKSEGSLKSPGRLTFTLEDSQFQEEFNSIGYTMSFGPNLYIYKDEERQGYYHYIFERDINITEITYHAQGSDNTNQGAIAKWIID